MMSLVNKFFKKLTLFENNNFAWLCYLFIFSLFFTRAGLAISGVLLFAYALFHYVKSPFKITLKPIHLFLFAVYIIGVLSVLFNAQNIDYGLHLLFKNAIFIVLPLAFILSEELDNETLRRFFLLILISTVVCVSTNTFIALLHYKQFLTDVSDSKNIVPLIGPGHSELGLLSALAFVLGFYLAISAKSQKYKVALFILLAFFFVELHIIAYRFSLICIYSLIALYGISELIKKKNLKLFLSTIIVFVASIYFVNTIPSIKNRFQNTVNDIYSNPEHRNPNYQSITQRILAVDCAAEVIKKYPWFGVSPANADVKMQEQYSVNSYLLIPENRMFIHNQFVFYVLCFGIPLGVLICLALLAIVLKNWVLNPLLFWLMLPFLFHMMIENTLEKQITANAFIFLFLVFGKSKKRLTI